MQTLAKLTVCYQHREERPIIGYYEYQIADDVRRFVPLYEEADRVRAKNYWKKDWGIDE
jgi:hypothetical protein